MPSIRYLLEDMGNAVACKKLIYKLGKDFIQNKNGQTEIYFGLSIFVPRTGFFTVWFSISYK
ncbi:hypothetical protein SAMN05660909_02155 [Chitinophaga terrae (ex Kim and Jung 2007)]|uniref:Uncharacterized protein n=1 Tax=Chitinophaga terrae (ex Kim and Jung 2007) TaxID=408074 RepID=A0A1H4BM44_9BACT|nr:hypothetical protein SAMN05660909_02155 [Chitinophaga terrae (ex Kim and Jung 2007)]